MLYFKNIKKKLFNYIAVLFLIISNISNPQAVKAAGANVTVKIGFLIVIK